jgi:hypothetical protein
MRAGDALALHPSVVSLQGASRDGHSDGTLRPRKETGMRNGRSRVREEGILEEILHTVRDTFTGTLRDSLRRVVVGILHQGMMMFIGYALAAVAILFGVVMLLNGVFHALRSIPLSEAVADVIVGGMALAGGLVVLLVARSSGRDAD